MTDLHIHVLMEKGTTASRPICLCSHTLCKNLEINKLNMCNIKPRLYLKMSKLRLSKITPILKSPKFISLNFRPAVNQKKQINLV